MSQGCSTEVVSNKNMGKIIMDPDKEIDGNDAHWGEETQVELSDKRYSIGEPERCQPATKHGDPEQISRRPIERESN